MLIAVNIPELDFSLIYPIINAIKGQASKYPPVGPNNTPIPAENCANTGTPIPPKIKYIKVDIKAHLEPKIRPVIAIPNICSVSGTVVNGNGIDI